MPRELAMPSVPLLTLFLLFLLAVQAGGVHGDISDVNLRTAGTDGPAAAKSDNASDGDALTIPYFPSASDALGRQGFARIVNLSSSGGTVSIDAFDDGGRNHGPVTLTLDALETVHFNSADLEDGAASKGLPEGTGPPSQGDWRLELTSGLDIKVLAYIRTHDGFVTSMHDVAPSADDTYGIWFFNPGSNTAQESRLRLVNRGDTAAVVTIRGVDDRGSGGPGGAVILSIPPGAAHTVSAADFERGATGLDGALGDGAGKWRLEVAADRPILAISMLSTPTGHLTNLSTAPGEFKSLGTGSPEPGITRAEFDGSTPAGYTSVTLRDAGSVWGTPERYTSDSSAGTVAYMLLGARKGCGFANAEADRSSRVYVKTQELGELTSFESDSVCRKTSSTWSSSFDGLRMTNLRIFDESSSTTVREYVYDTVTGDYADTTPGHVSGGDPAPDLAVENPTVDDGTPEAGASFTFSATVRNRGDAESAATTLRYYRSSDSTVSPGDAEVGTDPVSRLSAGAESRESVSLTASSDAGTYYYGACVDAVAGESDTANNCSAGVKVQTGGTPVEGDLRLVGGEREGEGRVEIHHDGEWGTVCDDLWDVTNAGVACRQLGYSGAREAAERARFGQGTGPIWMDNVNCDGSESRLADCPFLGWGVGNCSHRDDAGVVCETDSGREADLRLADGADESEGRVEIYHDGVWGTVCEGGWDVTDAGVACRQLGYSGAREAPGRSRFGRGTGPRWMDEVNCDGSEARLADCPFAGWGAAKYCRSGAGAVCEAEGGREGDLRLVGGSDESEGRVEVYHDGAWGTVCDFGWNVTDAGVACRQLGYSGALEGPGRARFGQGSDPVWMYDVGCDGSEPRLADCPFAGWGAEDCPHYRDAGAVCYAAAAGEGDLRLAGGADESEGRVEIYHDGEWGTVCDDAWDIREADVACRQLGYSEALEAPRLARFGQGTGPIWMADVDCEGTEARLAYCPFDSGWGVGYCSHREDAGVVCDADGSGGSIPDLVVESPAVDDDTPVTGASFTLSARVRNRGGGRSDSTDIRYYESSNSLIREHFDRRVGMESVGALAPGATSDERITLTAPSTLGVRYYGACVDAVDGEERTYNNCSDGVRVDVVSDGNGGTDSYCRDDDRIEPGDSCEVYNTPVVFDVSGNGTSCLRGGGIAICSEEAHRCTPCDLSGYDITLVADPNSDNSWTISDVEPEPD